MYSTLFYYFVSAIIINKYVNFEKLQQGVMKMGFNYEQKEDPLNPQIRSTWGRALLTRTKPRIRA